MATGIDASDFHHVAKALKKAQPAMYAELGASLKAAGVVVATDAKAIAAEHSESIPPTIKVQRRGVAVQVVAGGAQTPMAGLYELGNKGGGSGATFKHPVFGDTDVWVQQPRYPFLAVAGRRSKAKVNALVLAALDRVSKIIVFED